MSNTLAMDYLKIGIRLSRKSNTTQMDTETLKDLGHAFSIH